MQERLALGALVLNALIWGLSWWPFRLLAEQGLHTLWATALLYALAWAGLAAWQPAACRAAMRLPSIWLAAAAAGATNACFNWAVSVGDVVRVVLLFYLMPVWSMLLARVLLGEPLRWQAWLRTAVALAGAALVLAPSGAGGWPVPRGLADWLAVAGGVCFAATNVLLRREGHRPHAVRAAGMFAGGTLVPGALAVVLSAAGAVAGPPPPALPWLTGVAALSGAFVVANSALQYGTARLPAGTTALVMLTEVIFASVSAVALGAAQWSASIAVGGALIVSTSLAAAWQRPGDALQETEPCASSTPTPPRP